MRGSGCTGRPVGLFAPSPTPRGARAGPNASAAKADTSPSSPLPVLFPPTRSSRGGLEKEKEREKETEGKVREKGESLGGSSAGRGAPPNRGQGCPIL